MDQIYLTSETAKFIVSGFGRSALAHNQLPAANTDSSLPNAQKLVALMREFSSVSKEYAKMIQADEKKIQQYIDNVTLADKAK